VKIEGQNMLEININETIRKMAEKRPIFHNEADFQFSLAWEIQKQYPEKEIRLEYRIPDFSQKIYADIWINDDQKPTIIELKYKPKHIVANFNNERFDLIEQGAQDQGRYDECKDIQRIEQISELHNAEGYSIFLTNDFSYWKNSTNKPTKDEQFRIHEGRMINGILDWAVDTSEGTKQGRGNINIKGQYFLNWKEYSKLEQKNGEFRYLLVKTS